MTERILGDYQLTKQLGHGALGTVFLAEHRFMKRLFMLKILPESLSSDRTFVKRFEEHVAAIASLDHPHIVKIHNVSYSQGVHFLVSDCVVDVAGETTNLAQYLIEKGERLSEGEIFTLLLQIAGALDYAHTKTTAAGGLFHGGLKPNNILIEGEKGAYQAKLCDFSLSRVVGDALMLTRTYRAVAEALGLADFVFSSRLDYANTGLEPQKLTALHHSFLQSFAFLAPEQKNLKIAPDSRADRYAFGLLAYQLLTGYLPEGHFPLPSQVDSSFQLDWDPLIQQCLALDPALRPDSLVKLMEELRESSLVTAAAATPQAESESSNALAKVQPLSTEMVTIAAETFNRGSTLGNRDEMPRHPIRLQNFAIDVHPVTNEQFARYLEALDGEKDHNHQDVIKLKDSRIRRAAGKLIIESGYAKHPVVGVTWYGAIGYAKWAGKRLPTEGEWEVAALGGEEEALYPTGCDIEKNQANFFSSDTTAVKSYQPNSYGLYDMSGNVYEWCSDWYGYNEYERSAVEPDNPRGPLQGVYRTLRGGCWKSLKEDLRCAKRHRNNPGTTNSTYGFRCALTV